MGQTFETAIQGLENQVSMTGLRVRDNRLWSIDSQNTRLMTYTDSLCEPVTATSPIDGATDLDSTSVSLEWQPLRGATQYRWQFSHEASSTGSPASLEGTSATGSVQILALEPDTTYRWRVQASQPVPSPWSSTQSFTTLLNGSAELLSPAAGATGTPVQPVFQWQSIPGASDYELQVATDISFSHPYVNRQDSLSLPATAWQTDLLLDYDTTYYWRVRGKSQHSHSAWSATGAFITEAEPASASPANPSSPLLEPVPGSVADIPVTPPLPKSPPSAEKTDPSWQNYLIIALLVTVVMLLIGVLMRLDRLKQPRI